MSYAWFAFFMGLFGSVHCAVMCGPLIFGIQRHQHSFWRATSAIMLYQVGRVLTYGLLGLLFGLIGQISQMAGWQQGVSIASGVLLLLLGGFQLWGTKSKIAQKYQNKFTAPFARLMGVWLFRPGGSLLVGMFNGLLPCGMVYMALTSAVNADGLWSSVLFMLVFGLGTWPVLIVFSFFAQYAKRRIKWGFSWLLPILYLLMGVWFLLRGANLAIPYLSPMLYPTGAAYCQ